MLGGEVIGAACTDRALPPVSGGDLAESILATIRRRPCTAADLAALLGIRPAEVAKHLRVLESGGLIEPVREERGVFYRPV
ncbi:winged helix-turn-helix domain-containing protein [Methanoculleus chikugoensis]|uniref:ArsR/SmtB family transcription factor n=1 Tax=Methanoculleus chikugoensis TaxID=118126 RepID=UPI000A79570B|nr:winged helix-turn-helix domain-containing protein [Methanoculleus chikugoensis]